MEQKRILVVEDEIIPAENMKKQLEEKGYFVYNIVTSGEEAIRKSAELMPDLILMDIKLNGEIDGIKATEVIRSQYDIPILYLTSYPNKAFLERAKLTEPHAYILKPFRLKELESNIEIAIHKNKSEKKLKEVLASKDRFFSIIGHDLRGPLSNIFMGLGLLKDKIEPLNVNEKESILLLINSVLNSTEKTVELMENLLEWSRLQMGRMAYNPKRRDVYFLLTRNLLLYQKMASDKGIQLSHTLEPEETYVYADYNMIDTILRNLINNAIKFTPEGGTIEIAATENKKYVHISVSDTGVGIEEERLDRLFQVGERDIKTKGTQGESGTGLGLILCKELVEKHGGEIWVESEDGEGSTFTFSLQKHGEED
jgi:signal transduction histidine kinase